MMNLEDKEIADLAAKRRDLEARVAQRRAQKAREALKDAECRELSSAETEGGVGHPIFRLRAPHEEGL